MPHHARKKWRFGTCGESDFPLHDANRGAGLRHVPVDVKFLMGKTMKRKSPLKAKPLRQSGQSTDERLRELIEEDLTAWVLIAAFAIVLAAVEWYRWLTDSKFGPVVYSVFAVLLAGYVGIKIHRQKPALRALRLGRDGEIAVGQYLDLLQQEGHRVFHDLVADGFNVDHVLIGQKGIYVLETKTFGKRPGQNDQVWYQGGQLRVDGMPLDRDPISQVKSGAEWVASVLEDSTGKRFSVRSVLLFPGWYVNSDDHSEVWVLEPKGFPKFLGRQRDRLATEDVKLATFHLSRFIRTS